MSHLVQGLDGVREDHKLLLADEVLEHGDLPGHGSRELVALLAVLVE